MANKSGKKKARYLAYCREQVKKGLVNDESGNWIPHQSNKAMHRDQRAGYKL